MACHISCVISMIFIIEMIYFYSMTYNNAIVKKYKGSLSSDLQTKYEAISRERMMISYQGYALGFCLSLLIIFYNLQIKGVKNFPLVCTVMATCFLTNYFYYTLSPKSDWMLNHMSDKEETRVRAQSFDSVLRTSAKCARICVTAKRVKKQH